MPMSLANYLVSSVSRLSKKMPRSAGIRWHAGFNSAGHRKERDFRSSPNAEVPRCSFFRCYQGIGDIYAPTVGERILRIALNFLSVPRDEGQYRRTTQ